MWWSELGADSHTTSWCSFIGALRNAFGVPPVPPVLENNLEDDSEEDPEEDPKKDPMDAEDGTRVMENKVRVLMEEQPISRGTCPMVISIWPLMVRMTVIARGRCSYT